MSLTLGFDGHLQAEVAHELTAKVYRQATALRYAVHEAKKLPTNESILLVLHPAGRVIRVIAAGTGKRVPPAVVRRAKQALQDQLPHLARGRRAQRRTSRAARRTSRAPRGTALRSRRTTRPPQKARGRR